MIEAGLEALNQILTVDRMVWISIGVLVGLTVGMIPGMSGSTGMAILLPFVYGMDPYSALGLLMGMSAVTTTGDSFMSILMGVPGTAGSQATIVDGYAMTRKGEGAIALGAAFSASLVGGLFGALALFALIPIARPLVLAMAAPELFMLTLIGLSAAAVLVRGAVIAGLLSAVMGLMLGTIGGAPTAPLFRYTADVLYFYDGIPIAVIALGLFAIPEIIDLLGTNRALSNTSIADRGILAGVRATARSKFLVLRSSLTGVLLGLVPGFGGSLIDWVVYSSAKSSIRGNHFGEGDVRGVIAPEAANNAKEGGAIFPTLMFGIPGSGSMAVLLGGLVLIGLEPGPRMMTENLSITLSVAWTLAIANILGATLCLVFAPYITRLTTISMRSLAPFVLTLIMLATYQLNYAWMDLVMVLIIGIIAWAMKQIGWPRAPLLIGFALASATETYLSRTMQLYGWTFLTRPFVILFGLVVLSLVFGASISGFVRRVRSGLGQMISRNKSMDRS